MIYEKYKKYIYTSRNCKGKLDRNLERKERNLLNGLMINGKFPDDRENVTVIRIYKKSDPKNP